MHDGPIRLAVDLRGETLAVVFYGPNGRGEALLRLNPRLIAEQDRARWLLWAQDRRAARSRLVWICSPACPGPD